MKPHRFLAVCLCVTGLSLLHAPNSLAQGQKTGRIIIGVPPGASFDATARVLADRMTQLGGTTFIVENRPGAAQTIAVNFVARAPADGLTLLLSPIGPMVSEPQLNKQNARYDPFADFAPISLIATQELALAVGPSFPVTSLADYVGAIQADSNKGFYTSPGENSLPHFFGMLIGKRTGAQVTHVPYQGPAPAIQAVIGGQVPAMIVGYPDVIELHRAGRVRMLATSGATRLSMTPEVPTFVELGFPIQLSVWYGVFAPPATSMETIGRLNTLIVQSVRHKETTDYLVRTGHRVVGSGTQELADTLRRDFDFWGTFIRESGIKVQ